MKIFPNLTSTRFKYKLVERAANWFLSVNTSTGSFVMTRQDFISLVKFASSSFYVLFPRKKEIRGKVQFFRVLRNDTSASLRKKNGFSFKFPKIDEM